MIKLFIMKEKSKKSENEDKNKELEDDKTLTLQDDGTVESHESINYDSSSLKNDCTVATIIDHSSSVGNDGINNGTLLGETNEKDNDTLSVKSFASVTSRSSSIAADKPHYSSSDEIECDK